MMLMEAYNLTLRERVLSTKILAASAPTSVHLTPHGRALLNNWAHGSMTPAGPVESDFGLDGYLSEHTAIAFLGRMGTDVPAVIDRLLQSQ